MNHFPLFKKAALALAAAGMLASASAHADSLVMAPDQNVLLGFNVDVVGVAGTTTHQVDTTVFDINSGSFTAFCYELLAGISNAALTTGADFTAGTSVPGAVQTLFNQSYSKVHLNSAVEVAGFQIALWEALDDSNLDTGSLKNWVGIPDATHTAADLTEAWDIAWVYLEDLRSGAPSTGSFSLTTWSSNSSQDLISATPNHKVPEPTTLMLGALGLAGLSVLRRRNKA